jgi:flagellar hook-length control protein FliK
VRQSASELVPQTDTIEDVQRYQSQVMESNLAEKQLLKQMQSKVQAEIQAHVQSQQASTQTNLVSGSRIITDAGSNIPDNMLLTTASGIVTAPVQARSDAASAQVTNAPLTLPLLQSDADKTMSSNIRWMVNEGVKNAVVNVTPSGMGPISVSVGIENDHMSVSIVALQGSTREALDSMLPRLREQLAMQGHDSVKVDISNGGSENSDRGFGRSDSGDSQGTDHQSDSPAELTGITLDSLGADNEEENVDELKQGSLAVDKHGHISSHYDVYV